MTKMGFENIPGLNGDGENGKKATRRDFLKGLAGAFGVAITGKAMLEAARFLDRESGNQEQSGRKKFEIDKDFPTQEQSEIEREDSISSQEVLNFNNQEPIEFNLKTTEAIKNNWKEKYRTNSKLKGSLTKAYHDIGYWRPYLEEIFEAKGVPKEFIFLAIPESHWQPGAVSKAGAAGPYQFMPATAKLYGLKVSANYDERKDPLSSARACADLLSDLYKATNDWNLALSGYNGSFIWEYLKKTKSEAAKISYQGFLKYIEDKLNLVKGEVKTMARPVTRRFGRIITSPLSQAERQAIFNKKVSGFSENLNYPAKYYAIMELINEGEVSEQAEPVIFETHTVGQTSSGEKFYTVKSGDKNLYRISRELKVNIADLERLNPGAVKNLKSGMKIEIPGTQARPATLSEMAKRTNTTLARLKFLNPAIKENAPIITNQIRV